MEFMATEVFVNSYIVTMVWGSQCVGKWSVIKFYLMGQCQGRHFFYYEDLGGIWICPGERAGCAPRTAEFHWAHFPLDGEHGAVISFPYVVMSEPFLFYILKLSTVGKGAHFMSLK